MNFLIGMIAGWFVLFVCIMISNYYPNSDRYVIIGLSGMVGALSVACVSHEMGKTKAKNERK